MISHISSQTDDSMDDSHQSSMIVHIPKNHYCSVPPVIPNLSGKRIQKKKLKKKSATILSENQQFPIHISVFFLFRGSAARSLSIQMLSDASPKSVDVRLPKFFARFARDCHFKIFTNIFGITILFFANIWKR